MGGGELVLGAAHLQDYLIDFNQLLGQTNEWSVACGVCHIQSEANRAGLLIKVGSDDQSKIYLNGKEIYHWEAPRSWAPDQDDMAGVVLRVGLNVLVFKVVNETEGWQGSVRFTDAAGQPVKGIRVTLDPEARD